MTGVRLQVHLAHEPFRINCIFLSTANKYHITCFRDILVRKNIYQWGNLIIEQFRASSDTLRYINFDDLYRDQQSSSGGEARWPANTSTQGRITLSIPPMTCFCQWLIPVSCLHAFVNFYHYPAAPDPSPGLTTLGQTIDNWAASQEPGRGEDTPLTPCTLHSHGEMNEACKNRTSDFICGVDFHFAYKC